MRNRHPRGGAPGRESPRPRGRPPPRRVGSGRGRSPAGTWCRGAGGGEQGLGGPHLAHPAQEHDAHPVSAVADHPQVVGDEDVGEPLGCLEVRQQVEHLGLDGDVQGGHRLVAHHQPGGTGPGPGPGPTRCRWPPESWWGYRSSRSGARPTWVSRAAPGRRIPPGAEVVDAQGLGQGLAHGPPGVQGGGGVLKHQLHLPPEGPEPGRGQGGQVLAVKEHLPLGGGQQPQQEPA